jgi:hypothetical protein
MKGRINSMNITEIKNIRSKVVEAVGDSMQKVIAVSESFAFFCSIEDNGDVIIEDSINLSNPPRNALKTYKSKKYSKNFMRFFNIFAARATITEDADPDFSDVTFSLFDRSIVVGMGKGNNVYSVINYMVVDI